MRAPEVIVIGGGAAGFFSAVACAERMRPGRVTVLEKGNAFLSKVRISGGGRCNVTHACFDPRELAASYPRGERMLIGLFHRFQPRDTIRWFESRGVPLKTEADGRVFPASDRSETIVDCLTRAARSAGVQLRTCAGVSGVIRKPEGFVVELETGERLQADSVLIATGGSRSLEMARLASDLGHSIEAPVPSLFTFDVATGWVRELAGVAVSPVELTISGTGLCARGPMLMTHRGVSGPAVLRLSAWGARDLHARGYQFDLRVCWAPGDGENSLAAAMDERRGSMGARLVSSAPLAGLPARLWERIVRTAGIPDGTRWSGLARGGRHQLIRALIQTELPVTGKSLNKEEFVTCGGVRLSEVNPRTMESRICPGLYFAGETLDIDGITGGFNFQAAWTTGWLAGRAMAERCTTASPAPP